MLRSVYFLITSIFRFNDLGHIASFASVSFAAISPVMSLRRYHTVRDYFPGHVASALSYRSRLFPRSRRFGAIIPFATISPVTSLRRRLDVWIKAPGHVGSHRFILPLLAAYCFASRTPFQCPSGVLLLFYKKCQLKFFFFL